MENSLYLILNLSTISIPLACSFYPKAHFASSWRRILPGILIPLLIFVLWDVLFTSWGIWGFNPRYLTGTLLGNLPIEEWLFFVTIPYACLFTYFAIKHLYPVREVNKNWFLFPGISLIIIGLISFDKWYTSSTFIFCGILLTVLALKKKGYLSQFFVSFMIVLIPFFIVNGILTGSWIEEQVVWYNDSENLGIRLGTIPVEDVFYGMTLLLSNVMIWEEWNFTNSD